MKILFIAGGFIALLGLLGAVMIYFKGKQSQNELREKAKNEITKTEW